MPFLVRGLSARADHLSASGGTARRTEELVYQQNPTMGRLLVDQGLISEHFKKMGGREERRP